MYDPTKLICLLSSPLGLDWKRGQSAPYGWKARDFLSYKLCLTRLPDRRTYVAAIVFFAPIVRDGESPPLKLKKYAKVFFSYNKTINICQHRSGLLRLRSVGTLKPQWKCSRTFATNWWESLVKAPRSSPRKERQVCQVLTNYFVDAL